MTFGSDIRHGARLLRKDWGFTLAAVAVLSLGIAANMLVFTLVNGILLRDLPFDAPDRIVDITVFNRTNTRNPVSDASYLDLRDWNTSARTFTGIAGAAERTMNMSDTGQVAERVRGAFVSANAFGLIGQHPMLGRGFSADDDRAGATPVVILGYSVWQRRYQGDRAILGRTIRVNAVPSIVVGVMPDGFGFPQVSQLWQPLALLPPETRDTRGLRNVDAFGRLRDGVTIDQAAADLGTLMQALARQYPDTNTGLEPRLKPFRSGMGPPVRPMMAALTGTVAFVLLIACANVANLLLSRVAGRAREVSLRMSIGASRGQIVRQLLAESLVLAIVAGGIGLALSLVGIRVFWSTAAETEPPYWLQFPFDATVFSYLAAICLGTALIFGLVPALQTSKTSLVALLNDAARGATGGRRGRQWSHALVIGQIALTLVLLAGAAATLRGVIVSSRLDAGVDTSHLLRLRLDLPAPAYDEPEQRRAFYQRLDDRLATVTGMRATIADAMPLGGGAVRDVVLDGGANGSSGDRPVTTMVTTAPRYFETIGTRLVRGRTFTRDDARPGQEVAIVNERFAAIHFPGRDAVGERLQLPRPGGRDTTDTATPWLTIVGIAPNVRQRPPQDGGFDPVVYVPHSINVPASTNILVQFDGQTGPAAEAIRAAMTSLDPDLPVYDIRTVDEYLYVQRWDQRIFGSLFGIFAGMALVMAAVGLYAVTAYSVSQRTREFGVRLALGAEPSHVRGLVVRRVSTQVAIGLLIGAVGTVALSGLIPAILTVSRAGEPAVVAGVAALILSVAAVAGLVPAQRAVRVDPVVALRND